MTAAATRLSLFQAAWVIARRDLMIYDRDGKAVSV